MSKRQIKRFETGFKVKVVLEALKEEQTWKRKRYWLKFRLRGADYTSYTWSGTRAASFSLTK